MAAEPQGEAATASTKAVGGSDCVVWLTATCGSRCEPLINVVNENKPKVLACPTKA